MANDKKNDPAFDDFDDEFFSSLDTEGSSLENLDVDTTESNTKTDRKPLDFVKSAAAELSHIGRHASMGAATAIADKIKRELPEVTDMGRRTLQQVSELNRLKNDVVQDIKPTLNQTKILTRQMMKYSKDLMPEALYNKLDQMLATPEEERDKGPSKEEARESLVSDQLSNIFATQAKVHSVERKQAVIESAIDKRISASRFAETSSILNDIRTQAVFQTAFTKSTYTAYLKKSLELQYKQLFVAEDLLETVRIQAQTNEKHLDAIRHNTALPDSSKIHKTEIIKRNLREKFLGGISDWMSNFTTNMVKNITKEYVEPFKDAIGGINDAMSSMLMMMEMQESMGEKFNARKTLTGWGGGLLGKLFGAVGGRKLLNFIPEQKRRALNAAAANADLSIPLILEQFANRNDTNQGAAGIIARFLQNVLPERDKTGGTFEGLNVSSSLSESGGSITNKFTTSVETIIPGYLSMIHQQLAKMNGDTEAQRLYYSFKQKKFITSAGVQDEMKAAYGIQYKKNKETGKYEANKEENDALANASLEVVRDSVNYDLQSKGFTKGLSSGTKSVNKITARIQKERDLAVSLDERANGEYKTDAQGNQILGPDGKPIKLSAGEKVSLRQSASLARERAADDERNLEMIKLLNPGKDKKAQEQSKQFNNQIVNFMFEVANSRESVLINWDDLEIFKNEVEPTKYPTDWCKQIFGNIFGETVDGVRDAQKFVKTFWTLTHTTRHGQEMLIPNVANPIEARIKGLMKNIDDGRQVLANAAEAYGGEIETFGGFASLNEYGDIEFSSKKASALRRQRSEQFWDKKYENRDEYGHLKVAKTGGEEFLDYMSKKIKEAPELADAAITKFAKMTGTEEAWKGTKDFVHDKYKEMRDWTNDKKKALVKGTKIVTQEALFGFLSFLGELGSDTAAGIVAMLFTPEGKWRYSTIAEKEAKSKKNYKQVKFRVYDKYNRMTKYDTADIFIGTFDPDEIKAIVANSVGFKFFHRAAHVFFFDDVDAMNENGTNMKNSSWKVTLFEMLPEGAQALIAMSPEAIEDLQARADEIIQQYRDQRKAYRESKAPKRKPMTAKQRAEFDRQRAEAEAAKKKEEAGDSIQTQQEEEVNQAERNVRNARRFARRGRGGQQDSRSRYRRRANGGVYTRKTRTYAEGGVIDPFTGDPVGVVKHPTLLAQGKAVAGEHGAEAIVPLNKTENARKAYQIAKAYHEGNFTEFAEGGVTDGEHMFTNLAKRASQFFKKRGNTNSASGMINEGLGSLFDWLSESKAPKRKAMNAKQRAEFDRQEQEAREAKIKEEAQNAIRAQQEEYTRQKEREAAILRGEAVEEESEEESSNARKAKYFAERRKREQQEQNRRGRRGRRYAEGGVIDPFTGDPVGVVKQPTLLARGRAVAGEHGAEAIIPLNKTEAARNAYKVAKAYHEGNFTEFAEGGVTDGENMLKKLGKRASQFFKKRGNTNSASGMINEGLGSLFDWLSESKATDKAEQARSKVNGFYNWLRSLSTAEGRAQADKDIGQLAKDALEFFRLLKNGEFLDELEKEHPEDATTLHRVIACIKKGDIELNKLTIAKGTTPALKQFLRKYKNNAPKVVGKFKSGADFFKSFGTAEGRSKARDQVFGAARDAADKVGGFKFFDDGSTLGETASKAKDKLFGLGKDALDKLTGGARAAISVVSPWFKNAHGSLVDIAAKQLEVQSQIAVMLGHQFGIEPSKLEKLKDVGGKTVKEIKGILGNIWAATKILGKGAKAVAWDMPLWAGKQVKDFAGSTISNRTTAVYVNPLSGETLNKKQHLRISYDDFKKGVFDSDDPKTRQRIMSVDDIDGQVYNGAGKPLFNFDTSPTDIERGFCDEKGRPIRSLSRALGRFVHNTAAGTIKGIGKGIGAGWKKLKSFDYTKVKHNLWETLRSPLTALGAIKNIFTDVYRKDEVASGAIAYGEYFKKGFYVFLDGSEIKDCYHINKPVVWAERDKDGNHLPKSLKAVPGDIVISALDIEHGLVDKNNRSLGNFAKKVGGLLGRLGRLGGAVFKYVSLGPLGPIALAKDVITWALTKNDPYIDVYVCDDQGKFTLGRPRLTGEGIRNGQYYTTDKSGKMSELKSAYGITKPVLSAKGVTLITQAEIDEKRLVDKDGKKLTAWRGRSNIGKIATGAFGAALWAGRKLKTGLQMVGRATRFLWNKGKNIATKGLGKLFGAADDAIKSIFDFAGDLVDRIVPKDLILRRTDLEEVVGDRLVSIYNLLDARLARAPAFGDLDGDGDVENSYQDKQQRRREKEERAAQAAAAAGGATGSGGAGTDKDNDGLSATHAALIGAGGAGVLGTIWGGVKYLFGKSKNGLKKLGEKLPKSKKGKLGLLALGAAGLGSLFGDSDDDEPEEDDDEDDDLDLDTDDTEKTEDRGDSKQDNQSTDLDINNTGETENYGASGQDTQPIIHDINNMSISEGSDASGQDTLSTDLGTSNIGETESYGASGQPTQSTDLDINNTGETENYGASGQIGRSTNLDINNMSKTEKYGDFGRNSLSTARDINNMSKTEGHDEVGETIEKAIVGTEAALVGKAVTSQRGKITTKMLINKALQVAGKRMATATATSLAAGSTGVGAALIPYIEAAGFMWAVYDVARYVFGEGFFEDEWLEKRLVFYGFKESNEDAFDFMKELEDFMADHVFQSSWFSKNSVSKWNPATGFLSPDAPKATFGIDYILLKNGGFYDYLKELTVDGKPASNEEKDKVREHMLKFLDMWFRTRFVPIWLLYVSLTQIYTTKEGEEPDFTSLRPGDIPEESKDAVLNEFVTEAKKIMAKNPSLTKISPTVASYQKLQKTFERKYDNTRSLNESLTGEELIKTSLDATKDKTNTASADKLSDTSKNEQITKTSKTSTTAALTQMFDQNQTTGGGAGSKYIAPEIKDLNKLVKFDGKVDTTNMGPRIWEALKKLGLSEAGIAGVLGNLQVESNGLNPEISEIGKGFKAGEYTAFLDGLAADKTLSRGAIEKILKEPKHARTGYGLAQWTFNTRKAGLVMMAREMGKSVADPEVQMAYLLQELSQGKQNKQLLSLLQTTDNVQAASDAFMEIYEKPAEGKEHADQRRGAAQAFYDKLSERGKKLAETNSIPTDTSTSSTDGASASGDTGTGAFSSGDDTGGSSASQSSNGSSSIDTASSITSPSVSASDTGGGSGGEVGGDGAVPANDVPQQGNSTVVNKILQTARKNAQGASYSQANRQGNKSYDCSSFVSRTLKEVGFNISPDNNTDTLPKALTSVGFKPIPGPVGNAQQLQPGDIMLRTKSEGHGHTEIYTGDGKSVGAHSEKNGVSERKHWPGYRYTRAYRFGGSASDLNDTTLNQAANDAAASFDTGTTGDSADTSSDMIASTAAPSSGVDVTTTGSAPVSSAASENTTLTAQTTSSQSAEATANAPGAEGSPGSADALLNEFKNATNLLAEISKSVSPSATTENGGDSTEDFTTASESLKESIPTAMKTAAGDFASIFIQKFSEWWSTQQNAGGGVPASSVTSLPAGTGPSTPPVIRNSKQPA